jgi:hypothetical protein
MDFRFQSALVNFTKEEGLEGSYDLFSIAGTQKAFIDETTREVAFKQVELSQKLHGMTDVYLVAHWDCGAYGGSKSFENPNNERDTYLVDLQTAQELIVGNFSNVIVHQYLAKFDNNDKIVFEKIK